MATVETVVGVRELKARLSMYLRRVREGAVLVVTDRGRPIGRLVPVVQPREDRLADFLAAGGVAWSGHRLPVIAPVVERRGLRDVADLLLEDRG